MLEGITDCRRVLQRYAAVKGEPPRQPPLQGCVGGFSGAGIWRVDGENASWCLRRWPVPGLPTARLRELHRWLRYLHADGAVPAAVPLTADDGATFVDAGGATWQLEPWLPGTAEPASPGDARLIHSMQVLARLHLCSARYVASPSGTEWFGCRVGRSPAVSERLQLLTEWSRGRPADRLNRVSRQAPAPLRTSTARIILSAERLADDVRRQLASVADVTVPLLPCLRDVWREHLLFTGDVVTGIIDPSAARTESVAADISRWLGSVLGREPQRRQQALAAYQAVRTLSDGELRLQPVLDISNVLLSGLYWVERCDKESLPDAEGRLAARLQAIADRLEAMPKPAI